MKTNKHASFLSPHLPPSSRFLSGLSWIMDDLYFCLTVTLALPLSRWRQSPGVGGVEEGGLREADPRTRPQDPPIRPQDPPLHQDRPLRLPG